MAEQLGDPQDETPSALTPEDHWNELVSGTVPEDWVPLSGDPLSYEEWLTPEKQEYYEKYPPGQKVPFSGLAQQKADAEAAGVTVSTDNMPQADWAYSQYSIPKKDQDFLTNMPLIIAGAGAAAAAGAAMGGAAGTATTGGSVAAADTAGLATMAADAGLTGSAADAFVASGGTLGSTAAGGGGAAAVQAQYGDIIDPFAMEGSAPPAAPEAPAAPQAPATPTPPAATPSPSPVVDASGLTAADWANSGIYGPPGGSGSDGIIANILKWGNSNPLLASTGLAVGGGMLQGAFAPTPEEKAQAEANALADLEQQKLIQKQNANNLESISLARLKPTGKRIPRPGLISQNM